MSISVGINKIYFSNFINLTPKIPRGRYTQYLSDLYKIYPGSISADTLLDGDQATYAELGDNLFKEHKLEDKLKNIDTIVVAHWSQEFDPDYASCGPYFLHKYNLNSDIFDVCDNGTLAPIMGLKILKQYIEANASNNAMLLCLEQTTIPRDKSNNDIIPVESGALALTMSSNDNGEGKYIIKSIDIITENNFINNIKNIDSIIQNELMEFHVDFKNVLILIRRGTTIWKIISKNMLSEK